MELRDNNINEKIAYLRDTFLEAEKDYLDELKAETKYQKAIEKINKMDSKAICLEALRRIEDIENNNVKESDLERVETEIVILLASIQDWVRKRVKEKQCENSKDDGIGLE